MSVNHVVMTTQPPPCMLGDETVVVYNTVEGFLFYLEKQSSSVWLFQCYPKLNGDESGRMVDDGVRSKTRKLLV